MKIVKALPNKNIFFIPDRNLAHYIAGLVPEKNFIYNEGFCIVHEYMEVEEIQEAKAALQKRNPEKKFYFTETTPICRNMKKVTLEKVLHVLKTGENEVFVDDKLREESKKPLERMLELAK